MLATYVHARLTPLSFEEAQTALASALRQQIGKWPSREALALALAKTALETGRWKAIWNYNFGNVKAGEKYAGSYFCIELNEVLSGKVVWFSPRGRLDRKGGTVVAEPFEDPPGHPQTRMRAYPNAFEGAEAYVKFVAGGRYAAAWQLLLAGDAAGYVHALKVAGYFTADEATYAKGVVSLQREFLGKLDGRNPEPASVPPPTPDAPARFDTDTDLRATASVAVGMTDVVGAAGANLREYESASDDDDGGTPNA